MTHSVEKDREDSDLPEWDTPGSPVDPSYRPSAEMGARHWPECWCNGTGFRMELGGVPCNLPQLTSSERAYVIASREGSM